MKTNARLVSIDIMRGLTLLLMLFVNDLNMNVAPSWLGHQPAGFDGMGLADWVFPGFLFIVGMAIPFALSNRLAKGQSPATISTHIIIRTLSLLVIGILMLNTGRVSPDLTGMGRNLWALLMYVAVFFVWNDYPEKTGRFFKNALRLTGMTVLILLAIKFRSDDPANHPWLVTEWWGILGLIGWGYLVTAFAYLLFRDSVPATAAAVIFFLIVNMLNNSNHLGFLDPLRPVLGIIIEGNVPLIVLTGLLAGILIRKLQTAGTKAVILTFLTLGIVSLAAGFILRNWFIISKIQATPSWGMICSGISFIVFTAIYWLADVKGLTKWAAVVRPAGKYSLTTYLAPDILYYAIWMTGVPILIYKQSSEPLVAVLGSIAWALLMAGLTALLARVNIRLKL